MLRAAAGGIQRITLVTLPGQPDGEGVTQRQIDAALHAECVIVTVLNRRIAAELVSGALGDDVDGTRSGIAPIQGTLRTTQNFKTFDVDKVTQCYTRT